MDNRASSRFALVRGCKDSSGLREFGFGHRISLLLVALVLIFVIPIVLQRRPQPLSTELFGIRAVR